MIPTPLLGVAKGDPLTNWLMPLVLAIVIKAAEKYPSDGRPIKHHVGVHRAIQVLLWTLHRAV